MIVGWIGSLRPNKKRKTARYHAAALEIRIIGFRRVCRSPQKSSNGGSDAEFARDSWLNYVPVNSKTAHPSPPPPPGQSPGIWLALSSVQWGIWPKMRPARWGIWLSCQNVCQRSETCTAFTGHCFCRFHVGFSVVVVFISWNMPLFKVWSEDKLNKKFVVAENFVELVSKGKRFCLYLLVSWVHGVTEAACHWRVISLINIHIFKASLFLAIVFVYIYYSLNECFFISKCMP